MDSLPERGGTSVERALAKLLAGCDVIFDPIDLANFIWHHNIHFCDAHDAGFELADPGYLRLPAA